MFSVHFTLQQNPENPGKGIYLEVTISLTMHLGEQIRSAQILNALSVLILLLPSNYHRLWFESLRALFSKGIAPVRVSGAMVHYLFFCQILRVLIFYILGRVILVCARCFHFDLFFSNKTRLVSSLAYGDNRQNTAQARLSVLLAEYVEQHSMLQALQYLEDAKGLANRRRQM